MEAVRAGSGAGRPLDLHDGSNYFAVNADPRPSKGGDQLMFTYSDLGRLAECTAWVPGRIAHGC
ncbi:hypothetical protein [Streptomyces sp. NPDC088719]|uniref:hypothetical protein n=1 Tax=Streptomyces sp. NPDC088719 TaxID=3365872 RepID=UPI0037FD28C7